MELDIGGRPSDEPKIRAGFIGCGSHAFRNIYPTFQFAPVRLVATCDLDAERAGAFARQFGAERSYSDHREMLKSEDLDAVFIVTNYDEQGRPRYVALAEDCLRAGRHVWMEKPPASTCAEIDRLKKAAGDCVVMVGFKKMFFPANEKARELMDTPDFGSTSLVMLQYPVGVPKREEFAAYLEQRQNVQSVISFLDHVCHPVSLMISLLGMPRTLHYEVAANRAGAATFTFANGAVAMLAMTRGASNNGGMERTVIVSDRGRHITVENNTRVTYHRSPPGDKYGVTPNYFRGDVNETSATWEPEFSLGQLYNKGLFLLGYWNEVNEFASAILQRRAVKKCGLDHAWQITRIFEAFAQGPGKTITL